MARDAAFGGLGVNAAIVAPFRSLRTHVRRGLVALVLALLVLPLFRPHLLRCSRFQPATLRRVTPIPNADGYRGSPYFKIQIADTDRTLAAAAGNEVVTVPN